MRRAVIDIGTNSVKLLVAEVSDGVVTPLQELSEQTRLGAGFYEAHQLQPSAIACTAEAVARFVQLARSSDAAVIRLIATSAARDAVNRSDLLDAVWRLSGLPVEVISGDQEAELAFRGVCSDPRFAHDCLLILDVGGGSTEFIAGAVGHARFQRSYPIGTVRLLERIDPSDPPRESDWSACEDYIESVLEKEVKPSLLPVLKTLSGSVRLVGTGGTAAILASMECKLNGFDRELIEQTRLSRTRLWEYQRHLWSMTTENRRQVPGLPLNRADVILFGVAIFGVVMRALGLDDLSVSTRGIRFAAALSG
jgi:exopolyphosphatase/guanosine-5'-triphosphate,3'-diphosphate pyrophosphatase